MKAFSIVVAAVLLSIAAIAAPPVPNCGKAKLKGVAADKRYTADGGSAGWTGVGRGEAPTNIKDKKAEGDVACSSPTLEGMDKACLAEWKKAYCP